jgi:peptidoglycan hydrolase CwlO-like protein
MKKGAKNTKITIDDLAIMVAKGFTKIDERFDKVDERFDKIDERLNIAEKDINEVKENIRTTRNDVLNIGDKFVSYHTFDRLASRVEVLEKKTKIK